jgi:Raf kinase inhibitor-like YbhB/YbcL family protein
VKHALSAAAFAGVLALAGWTIANAQQPPPPPLPGAVSLLMFKVPARLGMTLKVTSPAFQPGGEIPSRNSQYQANAFPGLAWSGAPAGVKTYAVVLQDTDVIYRGNPLVHWIVFNIAGAAKGLPAGMTAPPAGARYGFDYLGAAHPYAGPKPPPGPRHHYHFQVFALDAALPAGAGDSLDGLTARMTGHVLASGELVGVFGAPGTP